jgi:methylated-DNA-[protein]-cysteine S-methyltransferase
MLEWMMAKAGGLELRLTAGGSGLHAIDWSSEGRGRGQEDPRHPLLREAESQLRAYFAGDLREFDLPLEPEGTAFQQRVWKELLKIPYGETWSYMEVARHIGAPSAVRAVGAANGANPIPIIVPCHRVIGASGKLVGYGGGLNLKRRLLALERGSLFEAYEN